MATETVLATYNDVKFIQGTTPMNQTNWQSYFGPAIPNGIYDGFQCTGDGTHKGIARVYDGTAFVNGICATVSTTNGYTAIPYDIATDRFICLRVYFNEQTAELISKTGLGDGTESWTARTFGDFIRSESAGCIRNDEYYELPIWYMGPSNSSAPSTNYDKGFDLRRIMGTNKIVSENPDTFISQELYQICKDHKYRISATSGNPIAAFDLINIADGATIEVTGQPNCSFSISEVPWFENFENISEITSVPRVVPNWIQFPSPGDAWTRITDSEPTRYRRSFSAQSEKVYLKIHLMYQYNSGSFTYFIEELA